MYKRRNRSLNQDSALSIDHLSMVVQQSPNENTPIPVLQNTSPNVIMELRTIQASIIKNLFESIREILVDINIVFTSEYIH